MMNRLTKAYGSGKVTLDAENFKPLLQETIDAEISASPLLKTVTERLYEYEEKSLPKKPIEEKEYYGVGRCPNCGVVFINKATNYCGNCGQALDWSVNDE